MVTQVDSFMTGKFAEIDLPVHYLEGTMVVQASNRLSVNEAICFKKTCRDLIESNLDSKVLLIDLNNTTFMDSSGLGALVSSFKSAQEKEIEFILDNVTPQVMAVLNLTGLDQVFIIKSSVTNKTSELTNSGNSRGSNCRLEDLPATHPCVKSRMKRIIDIVGSLVGLVITACLLIPIGIAISINDPGPIFFKQIRCGWMGKRFYIWKFRSMCVDAEAKKSQVENQVAGAFFKNDHDPRITKVGRFLRRTSLDELPQFWNVLKGEMSLVGTRPPTPDEVELYEVPEWQRLDVKPGMTGEWQVNGRSKVRNFEDVIRLDLQYQKNWSLVYDLQLIVKTISILFNKNSGAV